MAEISRTALFGKLNPLAYKAIEGATVFCKMRGNPYVELQHWFAQILNTPDSDLHRIIRHYELDAAALASDLTKALDRLPRGASSISDLSSFIESAVERGYVYGSLLFGEQQVRTGHLIVGMMKTPSLRGALVGISKQFERIKLDDLCDRFASLLAQSPENLMPASESGAGSLLQLEDGGSLDRSLQRIADFDFHAVHAGPQTLERDLLACHPQPAVEMIVFGE